MRIWMLTSEFADEVAGGIARYVENFSRLAAEHGHEVLVIGRAARNLDEQIGPRLRRIGFVPRFENIGAEVAPDAQPDAHPAYPYNVIGYAAGHSFELAQHVIELLGRLPRPDVIECQEFSALGYYLLHRKLIERGPLDDVPIVTHLHAPMFELYSANQEPRFRLPDYWTGQMEKACVVMSDGVVSPSRFLAARVESAVGAEHLATPIATVPYPVAGGAPRGAIPPRRGEVVYVGRLQLLKGVVPMLEGCERLWTAGADFRLTCIGGDTVFRPRGVSMRDYISRRFAARIADGRLRLPGPMEHAKVLERLEGAWVSIVGSHFENFPNVCIESMMVGQLVLGSRGGGQAEMIGRDGENGLLFDWSVPGDFERGLRAALSLEDGPRREITDRAHRRIFEYCDPASVLASRVEHFESVIARSGPRASYPSLQATQRKRLPVVAANPADDASERPGLLSVVVPFYNLGRYVRETIDSLLASSYRPMEIVIVNDGSTEAASLERLAELGRAGIPDLRIVTTENSGLAATRNNGADAARGEFLCFVDADDAVEPTYFARAIEILHRYANVDFITPWCRYFDGTTGFWPTWNPEFPYLLAQNMSTAFSLLRRRSFMVHGRNKPSVAYSLEDHEMWINMLEGGCIGVSLPEPLVRYRVRADSMLRGVTMDQRVYLLDVISHHHPALYREYGVELFNLLQANGPNALWRHPGSGTAYGESGHVGQVDALNSYIRDLERSLTEARGGMQSLFAEAQGWHQEATRLSRGWETQREHIEAQVDRIRSLETEAANWQAEARRVADGWESQRKQIELQSIRIQELERRIDRSKVR